MLEIIVGVLLVVAIVKIADADDQSAGLWGGITVLAVLAAFFFIPLPFLRVGIAGIVVFLSMIGYKVAASR